MLTKFSPFTLEPQNAASACASAMYVPLNALRRRIAITTSKENTYRTSVRMTSFLNVLKNMNVVFRFEFVIVC